MNTAIPYTTPDGVDLACRFWTTPGSPTSVVVIVHGYAEHCGRHAALAAHLVERGHAVFAYDQRGHGHSGGRRAYLPSFEHYLDDLGAMLDEARRYAPSVPVFLFGHSMGGAVATLYCLDRQPDLDGLILSSPALKLPGVTPLLRRLSSVISRLLPQLPTVKLNLAHLSRDPEVIARTQADPLYFHGRLPARTGAEFIHATQRIQQQMEALTLPVLLIHGTDDQITDPAGSAELYSHARSIDKTLALYPGLYHETLNEPEKDQVLEEIVEWLKKHV